MLAERQVTVCTCLALQNSCSNKLKAGGTPGVDVRRSSVSTNHQGVMPRAIVLKPVARSTAPAIAVAALLIEREDRRSPWP